MNPRPLLLVAVLGLVAAGCGGGGDGGIARTGETTSSVPASSSTSAATGGAGEPTTQATVVAERIAFSIDQLTVPAGQRVTVTFDNRDAGIPHSFHVTAPQADDARTPVQPGPVIQTVSFTVDGPGTYPFICDVHPDRMKGRLVAR